MKLSNRRRWAIFVGLSLASVCLIAAFGLPQQRVQIAQAQDTVGEPLIGRVTILYDGETAQDMPETQGFLSYAQSPGAMVDNMFANGVTVFDTTTRQADAAGYGMEGTLTLDRTQGYAFHVRTRLASETHANNNRAGFSLIALSSDLQGIEVGFWENEIWVQEGGAADLFTHAEGAAFDTTVGLTNYTVSAIGDRYSLSADATQVLSGTVRDYTAFTGFPDPYETANAIFLGDNTTSAQAKVEIAEVSMIVNDAFGDLTIESGVPLTIANIGIIASDSSLLTLRLSASLGNLTVATNVVDGVPTSSIRGNGGPNLLMSGSVVALNKTLATLAYLADIEIAGSDSLVLRIEDEESQGSTKVIGVNVTGGGPVINTPIPTVLIATATTTTIPLPQPSATPPPTATPGGTVVLPAERVYLPDVRK